jgi:hypothetical protein
MNGEYMDYQQFVPQRKTLVKLWLRKSLDTGRTATEYIAHQCGISHSLLCRQINPKEVDRHCHLHNLPLLVHETGDFTPLDEIELTLGRLAFFLPLGESSIEIHRAITQVHKTVGRLVAAVDETDSVGIRYLGHEAIRAICTLMAAVASVNMKSP